MLSRHGTGCHASAGTPAGGLPRRPGSRSGPSVRSMDGFGVQRLDAASDPARLDPPAGHGQETARMGGVPLPAGVAF